MAVVTVRQLLDSGVHFGHQTRRWNPKMKRFILTDRSGIYIIDLAKSLTHIDQAYEFTKNLVASGGSIMFVGTKKQAQEAISIDQLPDCLKASSSSKGTGGHGLQRQEDKRIHKERTFDS